MELQAPLLLSHAPSAIELMGKSSQLRMEYLPTKVSNHTHMKNTILIKESIM